MVQQVLDILPTLSPDAGVSMLQHVAVMCIVVCDGYLADSLPDARDSSPLLTFQNPITQDILAELSGDLVEIR